MANSTLSDWSDRASGAISGIRNRFGGSRSQDGGRDGYDRGGYDRGGYDDYGYDDYADYDDYGEYGYNPDEPYDDYTDAQGIGEVRTRSVPSSSRNHPPLLSFDEARVNTYVPDHLLRDPLDRRAPRPTRPRSGTAPRVRDSVNVGHAAEYDFASVGGATIDESGMEIPPVEASRADAPSKPAPSYDPYASFQGSGMAMHAPTRKLKVLAPTGYGEVENIARALKAGDVVVLVLTQTASDLAKRVLDFSFGVASALDASVDCAADKVFVVCRGAGLSEAERDALRQQGIDL